MKVSSNTSLEHVITYMCDEKTFNDNDMLFQNQDELAKSHFDKDMKNSPKKNYENSAHLNILKLELLYISR